MEGRRREVREGYFRRRRKAARSSPDPSKLGSFRALVHIADGASRLCITTSASSRRPSGMAAAGPLTAWER